MENLKVPAWSKVVNIIFLMLALVVILVVNYTLTTRLDAMRDEYRSVIVTTVEIAVSHLNEDGTIDDLTVNIIDYLDSIPDKVVGVYNQDLEPETMMASIVYEGERFNINNYPELVEAVIANQSGIVTLESDKFTGDAYFRWVEGMIVDTPVRQLLLLYIRSDAYYSFHFVTCGMMFIYVLFVILVVKHIIVGNVVLAKIARRISIKNLENAALDSSKY